MIALRHALSRSTGFFGIPLPQRAIYSVFGQIYNKINAPLGRSLQGRTSLSPRSFSSRVIYPSYSQGYLFPNHQTVHSFVVGQLSDPLFQRGQLNDAIATLCADRCSKRTMSNDTITTVVSEIYSDLIAGYDRIKKDKIQKFELTNNLCMTLDKVLPPILQECAKKRDPVD